MRPGHGGLRPAGWLAPAAVLTATPLSPSLQMHMLMKLQEAASYTGTQGCEGAGDGQHEGGQEASLESTL